MEIRKRWSIYSIIGSVLLMSALPAQAFLEDFSTLSNGSGENLSADDANLAGWTFNAANIDRYKAESGALKERSGAGSTSDKTAGKLHGVSVSAETAIALSFDAKLVNTGDQSRPGQVDVWMSDANQNGFGLRITRLNSTNLVRAIAFSGGTTAFGGVRNATRKLSVNTAYATTDLNAYSTLNLRIDQFAPGADIILTAWSTNNYADPLLTWTNAAPSLDLSDLTYIGLALDRPTTAGGASFLDNIYMTIPPELTATNGTPIDWLKSYGYTNDYNAAELDDPDFDGFPNWEEYQVDTIPTNSESFLSIEISGTNVMFDSSAVVTYFVEACDNLIHKDWVAITNIDGTGETIVLTETNNVPFQYYQLKGARQ